MKMRGFLLLLILLLSASMAFASGQDDATTTGSATTGETGKAAIGTDLQPGFYNLSDFEKLAGSSIADFTEAPMLAERVASGELPPLDERLPDTVLVMKTLGGIGEYGGTLQYSSFNTDQDWHFRHLSILNLIETPASSAYDALSTVLGAPMQPGVLESFSMSPDGYVFNARIREGMKWSDGVPVTTADITFAIEDVFRNEELFPTSKAWLRWGGEQTKYEALDDYSFRFTFAKPFGIFMESELKLWPAIYTRIMYPAHYLKKYHRDYASEADLLAEMEALEYTSLDEWPEFFNTKTDIFGVDYFQLDNGEEFPTLRPYNPVEDLGNGSFLYARNPYYPVVDEAGNQLPYIDYLQRTYVSDEEVLNMSIISGQTDMQTYTLTIDNYPLYKEHEADGNYTAMPLNAWQDQIILFIFNMYPDDESLREVYGDVRFRRAMSVALNRETMTEALYLGLGRPAQVAPRPGTPFYEEGMEEAWAQYDPDLAKKLLDEMGMTDRDGNGWRERPDGTPFTMNYEYFVITGASTPASELAQRYWQEVGVKVDVKQIDPGYYWSGLYPNNEQEATTWWLAGSGVNLVNPWFVGFQISTPKWFELFEAMDTETEQEVRDRMPDWAQEVVENYIALKSEPDEAKRNVIGTRIWQAQAEWLPSIGVATATKTPFVVSNDIGNVEMAMEMEYNMITLLEFSEIWYFKNPDRR